MSKQNNPDSVQLTVPNFFIVGFPKCGTTTVYENLRRHPEVFMPWDPDEFWINKEPNFFDQDIEIDHRFSIKNESMYLDLFKDAQEKHIGEASTFYIYSQEAPKRIYNMNPAAKIIIMLRNPVDMLVSWHFDCYRWGHENILDLETALNSEEDRKKGLRIPSRCYYPQLLQYKSMGKYSNHIARYLDRFGPNQVKVILLDDLKNNPLDVFKELATFLGLEGDFIPDQANHNPSIKLSNFHQATLGFWERFGKAQKRLSIFPESFWALAGKAFNKLFFSFGTIEKPVLNYELRRKLIAYFLQDLKQVEQLINRDLSFWYSKSN